MDDHYLTDLIKFQTKYNIFREESDIYENDLKISYNEISPSSSPLADSPLSSSCTMSSMLIPPSIERRVRRLLCYNSNSFYYVSFFLKKIPFSKWWILIFGILFSFIAGELEVWMPHVQINSSGLVVGLWKIQPWLCEYNILYARMFIKLKGLFRILQQF
jgi:hypothetical protein